MLNTHLTLLNTNNDTPKKTFKHQKKNINDSTYPFVKEKGEYMRRKCLAPEFHNQIKNRFSILRYPDKMIRKHFIKA